MSSITSHYLKFNESSVSTTHIPSSVKAELNLPYAVCEIVVAICAVIGNGLVIIVFSKEKKLRRRTNYYIISLATADLLVGLFAIPFAVLASIGLPTNFYACLFTVSVLVVLCTISIFCLVAVSIDRYWAILHPMGYSRNVRTKTAIGIICVCWIAGTLVGFLPLFGWNAGIKKTDEKCIFVEVMDYNYLVFLYFATIIFPALLIAAFYAHIYRVVVQQLQQMMTMNPVEPAGEKRQKKFGKPVKRETSSGPMLRLLGAAQKREVKATQNLSRIVIFFIICWFPLYTINCVKAFCPDCYVSEFVLNFCIILSHTNSVGNPLLYAYHLKDFRGALRSFICRILVPRRHCAKDANNIGMNDYRGSVASQRNLARRSLTTGKRCGPTITITGVTTLISQRFPVSSTPNSTPSYGGGSPSSLQLQRSLNLEQADESVSTNNRTEHSDNSDNSDAPPTRSNSSNRLEHDAPNGPVHYLREDQVVIETSVNCK